MSQISSQSGVTGGFTTTRRIADTPMLGGKGYTVKQTSTNKAGVVLFDFTGRQASLDATITPQSTTKTNTDGKIDHIVSDVFDDQGVETSDVRNLNAEGWIKNSLTIITRAESTTAQVSKTNQSYAAFGNPSVPVLQDEPLYLALAGINPNRGKLFGF
jgi:hypothetical protein